MQNMMQLIIRSGLKGKQNAEHSLKNQILKDTERKDRFIGYKLTSSLLMDHNITMKLFDKSNKLVKSAVFKVDIGNDKNSNDANKLVVDAGNSLGMKVYQSKGSISNTNNIHPVIIEIEEEAIEMNAKEKNELSHIHFEIPQRYDILIDVLGGITMKGKIEAHNIELQTKYGNVDIDKLRADEVKVSTTNGSIAISTLLEGAVINTSSQQIKAKRIMCADGHFHVEKGTSFIVKKDDHERKESLVDTDESGSSDGIISNKAIDIEALYAESCKIKCDIPKPILIGTFQGHIGAECKSDLEISGLSGSISEIKVESGNVDIHIDSLSQLSESKIVSNAKDAKVRIGVNAESATLIGTKVYLSSNQSVEISNQERIEEVEFDRGNNSDEKLSFEKGYEIRRKAIENKSKIKSTGKITFDGSQGNLWGVRTAIDATSKGRNDSALRVVSKSSKINVEFLTWREQVTRKFELKHKE